jgi:predicted DNA-binding protein with PD1-like motif
MEYTQGNLGRIYVLKFKDQDDLLDELKGFLRKEKLKAGVFVCIGALRQGQVVTGPKQPVIPPEPNWRKFSQGWELVGLGTVFSDAEGPHVHLHVSVGKKKSVITGCLRKQSRIFLVMEAVFFELKNVKAHKNLDSKTGLHLLQLLAPNHASPRQPAAKKSKGRKLRNSDSPFSN